MSYATRLASFVSYPSTLQPTPYQLSASGFTSKQNLDIPGHVHCMQCGIQFYGFKPEENPYRKHCEHSPTCHWILATEKSLALKRPSKSTTPATLTPSETTIPIAPSTPKAEPAVTTPSETVTPPATPPPPSEPALMLTPPISQSEPTTDNSLPMTPPATPIATPKKPISWAEIASRPVIAPKPSRLPIPTPKIIPKALETAAVICPPTPPPTPPQKPTAKHQKPYLTIEDLFEMFAEKSMKLGLLDTKKTESSPKVSYQAKITSYFRSAANQSTSISQGSKTPNPKSFRQLMPAEMIRTKSLTPVTTMPEKSAILPCKSSTFSRLPSSEISSVSPYKSPRISRCKSSICPPPLSTSRASFGISASCHACRICNVAFGFHNRLHRHLRAIHFDQATRRHRRWII
ncbi:hypothetical protein G7Y79_00008g025510 [Physcia stellaris]|nr:hypothetical protein G7Y79_00008g025510 [Physcia stellaris]